MILSQTAEYAVRAMLYIADQHPTAVRAFALAEHLQLPPNYLAKTLGRLARAGVLVSSRGSAGGFRLNKSPEDITLREVIQAFGAGEPRQCLLGLGPCGENPSCQVHQRWIPTALLIDRFFETTTIADLLSSTSTPALESSHEHEPVGFPLLSV